MFHTFRPFMIAAFLTIGLALSPVLVSPASAQGTVDPDEAEEVWVANAVIYCNALAVKTPWMVPVDPTCQELVVMGLLAGGKFLFPSPVE